MAYHLQQAPHCEATGHKAAILPSVLHTSCNIISNNIRDTGNAPQKQGSTHAHVRSAAPCFYENDVRHLPLVHTRVLHKPCTCMKLQAQEARPSKGVAGSSSWLPHYMMCNTMKSTAHTTAGSPHNVKEVGSDLGSTALPSIICTTLSQAPLHHHCLPQICTLCWVFQCKTSLEPTTQNVYDWLTMRFAPGIMLSAFCSDSQSHFDASSAE